MNFLEHTLDVLADNGKDVSDVVWIGTEDIELTWDEFSAMAEDEENLDAGFAGLVAVPSDLKVVGNDWWMDLEAFPSIEDDDQIEWVYREKPVRPLSIGTEARQEQYNRIVDSGITDFKIIFGDDQEDFADVIYRELNETYSE